MNQIFKKSLVTMGLSAAIQFTLPALAATPSPEASYAFVAADTKLWTEPTRFGEAKALLKTGVELQVIEYSSDQSWVRVKTLSGRTGWIPLRFTTQSGRRTFPLNAKLPGAGEAPAPRGPASVDLQAPSADLDTSKSWEALFGAQYSNQLSRENTSGFGFDFSALHRLSNNWSAGGAITWDRFSKSASSGVNTTSRSSHRIFPHVLFRYRFSDFRADFGMGYALDRSSITTRSNGAIVTTAPDGSLVTGSGSESSLGFRVTPRYILPMSRLVKVGLYATYSMDVPLSTGDGNFAGSSAAASSPFSYLSAGMSVSLDF